jgi:hypothetical protein
MVELDYQEALTHQSEYLNLKMVFDLSSQT